MYIIYILIYMFYKSPSHIGNAFAELAAGNCQEKWALDFGTVEKSALRWLRVTSTTGVFKNAVFFLRKPTPPPLPGESQERSYPSDTNENFKWWLKVVEFEVRLGSQPRRFFFVFGLFFCSACVSFVFSLSLHIIWLMFVDRV